MELDGSFIHMSYSPQNVVMTLGINGLDTH